MNMSLILNVVGVALIFLSLVILGLKSIKIEQDTYGDWNFKGFKVAGVELAVLLILLGLTSCAASTSVWTIDAQQIAVVHKTLGNQESALVTRGTGVQIVTPIFDKVFIYDLSQRSVDLAGLSDGGQDRIRAISNDGQQVFIDLTVVYQLKPGEIVDIHRQWQSNYEAGYIVPQARSSVRDIIAEYGAQDIYEGGRDDLEVRIQKLVTDKIQATGLFIVTDVLVRDISFTDDYMNSIEQKQITEQQAQQAENKIRQIEAEAQQARVEAQGRADAAVIAAQGQADARIIQAEAEAEALEKIAEALDDNPDLLEYTYIQKLADDIKVIIMPSNSPFIFDANSMIDQPN